jgi:hypothetical protein
MSPGCRANAVARLPAHSVPVMDDLLAAPIGVALLDRLEVATTQPTTRRA